MKKALINTGLTLLAIAVFVFGSLFLGKHSTELNQSKIQIGEINDPTKPGGWGCIQFFGKSIYFPPYLLDNAGFPYKFAYTTIHFPTTEEPACIQREFINPLAFIIDLGIYTILVFIVKKVFKKYKYKQ